MLTRVLPGLSLVELDIRIGKSFLQANRHATRQFYSSFPSLRTLRLRFYEYDAQSQQNAAKVVHTFLKTCRDLETLLLMTTSVWGAWKGKNGPTASLLELATMGVNSLDSGGPPLTTIDLVDSNHRLTPTLARLLRTWPLKTLSFSAFERTPPTEVTERFWSTLAGEGHSRNPIRLKRLRCPCLTPGLIHFLTSFTGLERLEFERQFYPSLVSDNPSQLSRGQTLNSTPEAKLAELQLLKAFFNGGLKAHANSLTHLSFCGDDIHDEPWNVTDYLEKICQCRALKTLHIHVHFPVDDLVSSSLPPHAPLTEPPISISPRSSRNYFP